MRVGTELLWVLGGQAAAFAAAVLTVKALTSSMGPDNYGLLALGLSVVGAIHMYVYGPIGQAISRYAPPYAERNRLHILFRALSGTLARVSLGILVLIGLLGIAVGFVLGINAGLLFSLAAVYGVVSGVYGDLLYLLNGLRRRKAVALYQGLDPWLRLIAALSFVALLGIASYVPMTGFVVGTLLVAIMQVSSIARGERSQWLAQKYVSEADEKECYKELLRYGMPFVLFATLGIVSSFSDRWILQSMYGERTVGVYAAIYQIANAPLLILFGVMNQFLTPIVFRGLHTTEVRQGRNPMQTFRIALIVALALTGCLAFAAFLFSKPLVRVVTSKEFVDYHDVLWILVVALAVSNFAQLLSIKGYLQSKPSAYAWPRAVFALASLVVGIPMAQALHVQGMAYATLISSCVYLICILLVNRHFSWVQRAA